MDSTSDVVVDADSPCVVVPERRTLDGVAVLRGWESGQGCGDVVDGSSFSWPFWSFLFSSPFSCGLSFFGLSFSAG
jgi:hypothetical protein